MEQNNKYKGRKTIIKKLMCISTWATMYSDGRGHYPPVRSAVNSVVWAIANLLWKSVTHDFSEEQKEAFDSEIFGW